MRKSWIIILVDSFEEVQAKIESLKKDNKKPRSWHRGGRSFSWRKLLGLKSPTRSTKKALPK